MAKKPSPSIDFEASLKTLEELVTRMEQGNLTLEESLACFEHGVTLTRTCQQALRDAEQKVQILMEREGEAVLETAPHGL